MFNGKPFADRTFDFTLQCLMAQAIPAALWPGVFSELMGVTRPSGYVELFEGGDVILNTWLAIQRFLACWSEASRARGFNISLMECLGRLLLDTHLRKIQVCTVPVGKWGGRMGTLLEKNILAGFQALKPLLCCVLSSDDIHGHARISYPSSCFTHLYAVFRVLHITKIGCDYWPCVV
jgi:hypothetical protein